MSIVPLTAHRNPVINNIFDNVYLGNYESHFGFDGNIINLSDYDYDYDLKNQYKILRIKIADDGNEPISSYFDKCYEFIMNASKDGKNVLIHCNEGVSRSVSIIIAMIMQFKKITLKNAIEYLKSSRNHPTFPKRGFFKQLIKYEYTLFSDNSLNSSEYVKIFYGS